MTHDFKTARHAFSDADDTGMTVDAMQNVDKLAIIKALRLASAIQDGKYVCIPVEPMESVTDGLYSPSEINKYDVEHVWRCIVRAAPDVWSELE